MNQLVLALGAALFVSVVSFVGLLILTHRLAWMNLIITSLIAFAAGAMLGDVFLHMLPEAIAENGYSLQFGMAILVGILFSLGLEAYIHCSHDSSDELAHGHHVNPALANLTIVGDLFHNFLDGIVLATSFGINPTIGIASTIAITLHEIPREFADVAILIHSGWSRVRVLTVNFVTGLSSMLGVLVTFLLINSIANLQSLLLPLAAGQLIYIATADLLPEIHRKSGIKKYVVEISMFIFGIVIMSVLALSSV